MLFSKFLLTVVISIYIATDERGPEELNFLRTRGIRLFEDLVTEDDRREFGWPLLYSDVIALVEQNSKQLSPHPFNYLYDHRPLNH
jgi:hypothetical protein